MSISLSLFIPQLMQFLPEWRRDFGFSPQAPVLTSLLSQRKTTDTSGAGFDRSLFSALGFPSDQELPIARYRVINDIFASDCDAKRLSQSTHTLLCADPVHCEASMKDVTLIETVADLDSAETEAFMAFLNEHFGEDGLRFCAAQDQSQKAHWYCQLPFSEAIRTTAPDEALGKNIFAYLPESKDRNWLALQNETQMLLHSSRINQSREIAGLSSVNSLWFWGGGERFEPDASFDHVFADKDCASAQVFATANGSGLEAIDMDRIGQLSLEKTDSSIALILDQLRAPAHALDLDAWQQKLNELEQNIIAPLTTLWKKGRIRLSINLCHGKQFTPLKRPRWSFWKSKPPSLLDLV